jgi:hypothetical protein
MLSSSWTTRETLPLICQGVFENLQGNEPERKLIAIMHQVSAAKTMAALWKIAARTGAPAEGTR